MTGTILTVAPGDTADLVRAAKGWEQVGAAIVHLPDAGAGTVRALREHTGLVVRAPLEADPDLVTCPPDAEAHVRLRERGVVAAYEVVDLAGLGALRSLLAEHGPPYGGHVHVEIVLGAVPGTTAALVAAVAALPEGATFSAAGLGEAALPALLASLSAGGHLRVGRQDTPEYAPGEPVRDDAQLVARAAGLARIAQRPPMPVGEVRALLGVPARTT